MVNSLFAGWGAFWIALLILIALAAIVGFVIYRKSVANPSPSFSERPKTAQCPACQAHVAEGDRFCGECGMEIPETGQSRKDDKLSGM